MDSITMNLVICTGLFLHVSGQRAKGTNYKPYMESSESPLRNLRSRGRLSCSNSKRSSAPWTAGGCSVSGLFPEPLEAQLGGFPEESLEGILVATLNSDYGSYIYRE